MAYLCSSGPARGAHILASIALVVVCLAACTVPAPMSTPTAVIFATVTPAGQEQTTVRAGVVGSIGEAGQYLAQSKGYFAQQGISADFVKVDPASVAAALTAGEVDVAGLGIDSGLFTAMEQGVDFRIVATQVSSEQGANGAFFVARKELIDTGRVRTFGDLRGLKVGIPARGTSTEYLLARAMEASGSTIGDLNLVVLNFPATLSALGTGAIDVGYLPDPLATVAVQNGAGVKWKAVSDVAPGFQIAVVVFSPQLVAQRDLATRWMTAYVQGIRDYNDAFVKNTNRPATVRALADALSISPALFDGMGFARMDPDGKVNVASVEDLMNWYLKMGYLSAPVNLATVIDASFADTAVAKLGPYR